MASTALKHSERDVSLSSDPTSLLFSLNTVATVSSSVISSASSFARGCFRRRLDFRQINGVIISIYRTNISKCLLSMTKIGPDNTCLLYTSSYILAIKFPSNIFLCKMGLPLF